MGVNQQRRLLARGGRRQPGAPYVIETAHRFKVNAITGKPTLDLLATKKAQDEALELIQLDIDTATGEALDHALAKLADFRKNPPTIPRAAVPYQRRRYIPAEMQA